MVLRYRQEMRRLAEANALEAVNALGNLPDLGRSLGFRSIENLSISAPGFSGVAYS